MAGEYNPYDPRRFMQGPGQVPQSPLMPQPQQAPPSPLAGPPPGGGQVDPTEVTPELLAMMAGTQGDMMELDAMTEQLARANALRDTEMPGMRGEGGRVQTAANPLEFIGAGIKQYRGAKEARALEEGVRNKGYAPGVTKDAQPEYSRMGRKQIREKVGKSVKTWSEKALGKDLFKRNEED